MGVGIRIRLSKSITRNEWEKVYDESLQLIKAFPLAEMRKVECRGVETLCLVPTEDRVETSGRNCGRRYWKADGDYTNMHTAEEYKLFRDMFQENELSDDAGDVLLGYAYEYLDDEKYDMEEDKSFSIWGNKTQGETYHIYLLAIACLIEFRLGKKALVLGDITRGQCKHAVELANEYLNNPIAIPDRCDMKSLKMRVSDFTIGGKEQMIIFDSTYLGSKNNEYGEFLRSNYSEEICEEYWRDKFADYEMGTLGFNENFKNYLLWGFDLRKMCELVNFGDGNKEQYIKFVRKVMDAKLHKQNKNCKDILEIDQERMQAYTIYTLFAQFAFSGAENQKVDRYIPIEIIRKSLADGLADKCDVNAVIDEYLIEEERELNIDFSNKKQESNGGKVCRQNASEVLTQILETKRQKYLEMYEQYDIVRYEDLIEYTKGDSIEPHLLKALKDSFDFYRSMVEEDTFELLMNQSWKVRCEWLTENASTILIRDKDWDKIFADIEENEISFSRYYPMVRVKADCRDLVYMIIALVLNDDLYDFCIKI